MRQINIVYVDDDLDENISRYLANHMNECYVTKYDEICFKSNQGYESLLDNELIKEANIIFIDSKLFENNEASEGKFSGEEFKMILKKLFPFIEVIVITQNELSEDYGTLSKYKGGTDGTPQDYYSHELKKALDSAIININIYRNIAGKLKLNEGIDKVLLEKIISSLDGTSQYDELKASDIDDIIAAFKEIQREFDEK